MTCPAVSPESGTPCILDDTRRAHLTGHEGHHPNGYEGHKVSWATTQAERERWSEVQTEGS